LDNKSKEHFLRLNSQFRDHIERSFESSVSSQLTSLSSSIDTLLTWHDCLPRHVRPNILAQAITELELAMQAAVHAQYRPAMSGVRLFLEQVCRFAYLSASEISYRKWSLGLEDVTWGHVIQEDTGVFSTIFAGSFFPEIRSESKHMLALAKKLYRELSAFVHGSFNTLSSGAEIGFDEELLDRFVEHGKTAVYIANCTLILRFLKGFSADEVDPLRDILLDSFRHIEAIEEFLS
jgi:hypothetical protein